MAIPATAVWEVRTTGNAANGGFFVPGTGGTVDYSQQDNPQLTVTDAVTSGTTTVTSATGGFTTAMVNNGINIGGTRRQITVVTDTNTITIDATLGAASGQTAKVGGAAASLGGAMASETGGNVAYLKGTTGDNVTQAVYSVTSTSSNVSGGVITPPAGVAANQTKIIGYTVTRGDAPDGTAGKTRPLIQASGIATFTLVNATNADLHIEGIEFDGANLTSSKGVNATSTVRFYRCKFINFTNSAVSGSSSSTLLDHCFATGCSGAIVFSLVTARSTVARNNTQVGFALGGSCTLFRCVSAGNTVGVQLNSSAATVDECSIYGNSSTGATFLAGANWQQISNTIFDSNGGYGISSASAMDGAAVRNCAFYNNANGQVNTATVTSNVTGSITLTASPFVDPANGDFRLNNKVGGGALVRGAAFPAAFAGIPSTTNSLDVGAAQHPDNTSGALSTGAYGGGSVNLSTGSFATAA